MAAREPGLIADIVAGAIALLRYGCESVGAAGFIVLFTGIPELMGLLAGMLAALGLRVISARMDR